MKNLTAKFVIVFLVLPLVFFKCSTLPKKSTVSSIEIQYEIINYLKKNISIQEKSILKGLLWSEKYVQKNEHFDYIFSDYLVMLNELYKSQYEFVREISEKLIYYNLKRGSTRLKNMFENSVSDKWDFISVIPIVLRFKREVEIYSSFYRNNFPETFNNKSYHKYSFNEALAKVNHDELGNYIIDMVFVDMIKQKEILFPMPKNSLKIYMEKLKNISFKYTQLDLYHDQNYFITHIVLVESHYGDRSINANDPLIIRIKKYFKKHFINIRYKVDDIDLLGEVIHCWKICKMKRTERFNEAMQYLVKKQNPNGSWYDVKDADDDDSPYDVFHPTWAVITALSAP